MRSASTRPASSLRQRDTSAPRAVAASRCRSGLLCTGKRKHRGRIENHREAVRHERMIVGYPGARYCLTPPATGYAIACGRCTPALPNPMPAKDAASTMPPCASSSSGCSTARTRWPATIRIACSDQRSLIGLAPWYGDAPMARGPRSIGEGDGRERLDGMTQDVEAGRRRNRRRRRARVVGIEEAKGWLEQPARDAGLHMAACEVEDRDAGRFAAGARSRRNREERLKRTRNG